MRLGRALVGEQAYVLSLSFKHGEQLFALLGYAVEFALQTCLVLLQFLNEFA